ncbi:MAG TPA: hypothetical protein PLP33_27195 [Leptospiraceae bacterium]|nr:hypothetical protein [Leptospiraceae bacterium]
MKQLNQAYYKMRNFWPDSVYGMGLGVNCIRVYVENEGLVNFLPKEIDTIPIEYVVVKINTSQKLLNP